MFDQITNHVLSFTKLTLAFLALAAVVIVTLGCIGMFLLFAFAQNG